MSTIGHRLEEERKRLGFNQTDFSELGGVKRKTQGNYESDERRPDAEYLAGIAKAGADIMYIVIGEKQGAPIYGDEPLEASEYRDRNRPINNIEHFSDIMDRLKDVLDLKADSAIAEYLGMAPTAYSNRKKTGSVPYQQIINASIKNSVLLDYIFTGIPPVMIGDVINKSNSKPFDQESLEIAIECVELYIDELDLKVPPAKKAKVIRMLYPLIRDDEDNEVPDNVIDLLQLASEAEEEEKTNEQKEKVVDSDEGTRGRKISID